VAEERGSLGDFELLEEIGRGGMGVVFRARQKSLGRVVALKRLLGGRHAGDEAQARFRQEAEHAASLQHPGIVGIHEIGEQDGDLYFAMEFVEGRGLDEVLREGPVPYRQAAAWIRDVAEAIGYAHGNGVLHRDLKPANILVDASGAPRVTDFGLARRESSDLTQTGQILGTPGYLPPEQARGETDALGPWSDVYALGALLYELVCGRPPFRGETPVDTVLASLDRDPVAPRSIEPRVPRDLETICLKCLRKIPGARYASASALAGDLRRYLDGRPIEARPAGPFRRAAKWARRRPAWASLIVVVAAAVVAVVAGSLHFQAETRERLWLTLVERVRAERLAHRPAQALAALEEAVRIRPSPELRAEALQVLALRSLRPAGEVPRVMSFWSDDERPCAFAHDGTLLFVATGTGGLRDARLGVVAYRVPTWEPFAETPSALTSPFSMRVSSRGHAAWQSYGERSEVIVWNPAGGEVRAVPAAHGGPACFASHAPWLAVWDRDAARVLEGAYSVAAAGSLVEIWDLESRTRLRLLNAPGRLAPGIDFERGPRPRVTAVAWSGDGSAVGWAEEGAVHVAGAAAGELRASYELVERWTADRELAAGWSRSRKTGGGSIEYERDVIVHALQLDASGRRVFAGTDAGELRIGEGGAWTRAIAAHDGAVRALAATAGVARLVTGGADGRVCIRNPATGDEIAGWKVGEAEVRALAVSADGSLLVTGTATGLAQLWPLPRLRRELARYGLDW